ncbi:MAG: C40 family peptidase [Magnetococcus sp. MYC-9]
MDALPPWVQRYIGLPYQAHGRDRGGVDCWGLLFLVYREQFAVSIPSYDGLYVDPAERADNAALLTGHADRDRWHRVSAAQEGDGVLLRVAGYPCHVGVAVGQEAFLHVRPGSGVVMESLLGARWRSRIEGFYRWGTPHE